MIVIIIQIATGLFLRFFYVNDIEKSFLSVIILILNTNYGWIIHLLHANFVSVFFVFIYLHIIRNIINISIKYQKVWISGYLIYLLLIAIAFFGYVLVWGQISLWGATVITNLLSVFPIGDKIVLWLWGRFSVRNPLLKFLYSLHFLLPFVLILFVFGHIYCLHFKGSSDFISNSHLLKVKFDSLFLIKDIISIWIILLVFLFLIKNPMTFLDRENFLKANFLLSPLHIKPEWYFLYVYAILRRIPRKVGGVVISILILLLIFLMFLNQFLFNIKNLTFIKFINVIFIFFLLILSWLGGKTIEYPYTVLGIIITIFRFLYFVLFFNIKLIDILWL